MFDTLTVLTVKCIEYWSLLTTECSHCLNKPVVIFKKFKLYYEKIFFHYQGFSLTSWMSNHGYSEGDVISSLDKSILMDELRLAKYLSDNQCNPLQLRERQALSTSGMVP